ncbi:MAG: hypothetical protein KC635_21015 [Myxococcales bacterium]|nr:hypothetical protein [Myxococcales bacterium]MCB9737250.1 hypothetical protein [Deltaproteobacteria bacterium]
MSTARAARAAWPLAIAALLTASATGCLRSDGESCRVDSDCGGGAICALDNVCRTVAAVEASLDTRQAVDVVTYDTVDTQGATGDATGCEPVAGVFDAATGACPEPTTKRTVTAIVIAQEGGLAGLAEVANQVIANGFDDGSLTLELWIDGSLAAGCARVLAWMRGPEDRNADCTAVFSDAMPFVIPGLVTTSVDHAQLDPETLVLTGLVDKAKLIESMAPELRDVAEQLITLDVDTDGDEVADMASAVIQITLAE